jgi:hypothetical protein
VRQLAAALIAKLASRSCYLRRQWQGGSKLPHSKWACGYRNKMTHYREIRAIRGAPFL